MKMKTEYANRALFMRVSKSGEHVYIRNNDSVLSPGVDALISNVTELNEMLKGKKDWCKFGVANTEPNNEKETVTEQ
jgi:hypothetical protein